MGRASDNTIILNDHLVSRYHAELVRDSAAYVLRDLGSKNGLRVNGLPTSEHALRPGDQIKIGKTGLVFEVPQEFRAARFSETMIHLMQGGDDTLVVIDEYDPPTMPTVNSSKVILQLSRLLDCDSDDLPELLKNVLSQLTEMFQATAGAITLKTQTGDLRPLVALAQEPNLGVSAEGTRRVLADGCAVLAPAYLGHEPSLTIEPRKSLIVPFTRQDKVLGALHLVRGQGAEFTPEDLAFLLTLARLISGVIRYAIQMDQLTLIQQEPPSDPYVGSSSIAASVRERIRRVATSESTVLLTGETGTGKELVSRLIHAGSERHERPFVAIDCASIPANLMESELFGHEAGAFTGADRLKRGKIEMAEGGTLFLDEIGEMAIELQPKLLRFLEELVFYRVGGLRPIQSDVRIIAATNRNLQMAVQQGRFRQDLLFRLNVMPINLPPLRMRNEDVRPLVNHFAPRIASRLGKPFLGLLDEAWDLLERYPWPGNVRELRHGLERALILSDDGLLRSDHFQLVVPDAGDTSTHHIPTEFEQTAAALGDRMEKPATLAEVEAEAISRALRFSGGSRIKAAQLLQIHRNTLAKKIQEYEIDA